MKKIIGIALAASMFLTVCSAAENESTVRYAEAEGHNYDYVSVARDAESDEIIPLTYDREGYIYVYTDGEFKTETVPAPKFSDMVYSDLHISDLAAKGVLNGFADGTFRQEDNLTRAQMAAVFARMFRIAPSYKQSYFSDVEQDSWYAGYVTALTDEGVFKRDSEFNPDEYVTREQLVVMLYRMLTNMGAIGDVPEYDFAKHKDTDKISDYAKEAYTVMTALRYVSIMEIIDNDWQDTDDDEFFFAPQKCVTRWECAAFLYNFLSEYLMDNAPAIKRKGAPDAEIPVLDGSTSTYEITRNIYNAYYINADNLPSFPQKHSKTSNSYKRLIDGEVEMIFVPDPSEEIENYAKEKGVELKYIPIASEALVFFTSADNETDNITTKQLNDIYVNNSVSDWNEIGGPNAELVPYCRNNDSGSHAQMEKFVLNGGSINENISREHTSWLMSSILTEVDDFNKQNAGKYAIGYTLYYYYILNQQVLGPVNLKLLSVDGVTPTDETLADGTYPYKTNYYAVIRDEQNEKVERFAEEMLGEFGAEIVQRSGYDR